MTGPQCMHRWERAGFLGHKSATRVSSHLADKTKGPPSVRHPWRTKARHVCVGLVCDVTVVKLTQSLAAEWANRGLQVNCVSPGIVNTALIQVCE